MQQRPMNLSAERGLLGVIFLNNLAVFETGNLLHSDFAEKLNGELFRLAKDQIVAGRSVTPVTLLHDAQDAPVWGDVRASDYIRRLEDEAPQVSQAKALEIAREMAATIRDTSLRSRIISAMDEFRERVIAAPVSIRAELLRDQYDETMAALFTSAADLGIRQVGSIGEGILARLKANVPVGMPIGLRAVQDLIGPLMPGKVYFVGGTPGSGKSVLALQIALYLAEPSRENPDGYTSIIFSPEMQDEEQVSRALSGLTGIRDDRIDRGLIDNQEYEALWHANEKLKPRRVFIDGYSNPSLAMIRGRAMRQKRMGGLHAVFIDHCSYLAKPDPRMSEPEAIIQNMRGLKQLAKDLDVALIPLVQFGTDAIRDMSRWPHRLPSTGDLAYAAHIDQNADAILLLHRREAILARNEPQATDLYKGQPYKSDWEALKFEWEGKAEAILGKRRSGGIGYGRRVFGFDGERYRFTDEIKVKGPPVDDLADQLF